jgi:hypothetical protein
MRVATFIIIFLPSIMVFAQKNDVKIKIYPQINLKIGSQQPALGAQFDLASGILLSNKYFAGIGAGYSTNMGMGGPTFPLYGEGRVFFSTKPFLFRSKDEINHFYFGIQIGMHLNNNEPFKTGFLVSSELAYRFEFLKLKEFKIPPFYGGINVEYNYSRFIDEYRGYRIQDGYLKHIMFNLKVSFDLPGITINKEKK